MVKEACIGMMDHDLVWGNKRGHNHIGGDKLPSHLPLGKSPTQKEAQTTEGVNDFSAPADEGVECYPISVRPFFIL